MVGSGAEFHCCAANTGFPVACHWRVRRGNSLYQASTGRTICQRRKSVPANWRAHVTDFKQAGCAEFGEGSGKELSKSSRGSFCDCTGRSFCPTAATGAVGEQSRAGATAGLGVGSPVGG